MEQRETKFLIYSPHQPISIPQVLFDAAKSWDEKRNDLQVKDLLFKKFVELGYLSSNADRNNDILLEASIEYIQMEFDLPITKRLDRLTLSKLYQSRYDNFADVFKPRDLMNHRFEDRISLPPRECIDHGIKWPKQTITFSFQKFKEDDINHQRWQVALRNGFTTWSDASSLKFHEEFDRDGIDIRFRMSNLGSSPPGSIMGQGICFYSGTTLHRVTLEFDEQEIWYWLSQRGTIGYPMEYYNVAVHLVGHLIGLGHSSDFKSIMGSLFNVNTYRLSQSDINIVKRKYAPESSKYIIKYSACNNPGATFFQHKVFFAWADTDPKYQINVMSSTCQGNFHSWNRVVTEENTKKGVTLCPFKDKLYMAWIDKKHRIVVKCSPDGKVWGDRVKLSVESRFVPSLTTHSGNLVLGFTDKAADSQLCILLSNDGIHWSPKKFIPMETSYQGPSLTSLGDRLYIAWVGTDTNHFLNVMHSGDCGSTWQSKMILDHRSSATPDLHTFQGESILLSWVGLESNKIHISTSDSCFKHVITLNEYSDCIPQLVENYEYGSIAVLWKDITPTKHLCMMPVKI